MKHVKTFEAWIEESKKSKPQEENIAFWAGSEAPTDSDDPDTDNVRRMFKYKEKPVKGSNAMARNISYI